MIKTIGEDLERVLAAPCTAAVEAEIDAGPIIDRRCWRWGSKVGSHRRSRECRRHSNSEEMMTHGDPAYERNVLPSEDRVRFTKEYSIIRAAITFFQMIHRPSSAREAPRIALCAP